MTEFIPWTPEAEEPQASEQRRCAAYGTCLNLAAFKVVNRRRGNIIWLCSAHTIQLKAEIEDVVDGLPMDHIMTSHHIYGTTDKLRAPESVRDFIYKYQFIQLTKVPEEKEAELESEVY
jgi:hypothetical protein